MNRPALISQYWMHPNWIVNSTSLLPTTVQELSIMTSTILSKSCCLDPLPSQLVFNHLDDLLPVICRFVNLSLERSHMPPALKEAVVQPTLVKPPLDLQSFHNFRQVFNLKMVFKIIEKVVADRLNHYLSSEQPR